MCIRGRLFVIVGLLCLFVMFGCAVDETKRVGLLIHQQDDRWSMDVEFLKEYFTQEGIQLIIKDAEGDENRQLKQVEELIDQHVDVVLIVPVNQNTAAGIVRYANEHNTPIVAYDRMVKNSNLDYLLSFEYAEVGRLLAQYSVGMKPKGNYILLWGDAFDNNARIMQEAQMEVLQPFIDKGDVNIVYKGYVGDWSYENSVHKMNEVLDFTDVEIDVVMANNDVLASGAIDAIEKHSISNVLITGHDATLEACRFIVKGKQAMTIYKPISKLAKTAVNVSKQIIAGEEVEITRNVSNGKSQVQAVLLDPIVVDQSNLESVVIADGLHSKEEVYN